ncbi:hypothetical protein [Nocardia sp. NPDC051981]|uniref:hypothetical protein n=1 Tax=Nocardia sp. NPDC051981 TaxID=3155417 RepID=UPI0034432B93
MTGTPRRIGPHATDTAVLERIGPVLHDIARDLATLRQLEHIQRQHQITLACTETIATDLRVEIATLAQDLAHAHALPEPVRPHTLPTSPRPPGSGSEQGVAHP